MAKDILSTRRDLVERAVVQTEAEQIVIAALRKGLGQSISRIELFSRAKDRLSEGAAKHVVTLAMARAEGKLLQHVTGTQFFLHHEYEVSPSVLIPRPETELLASMAMTRLLSPALGLEVGLGSGILSIELLARFPQLRMIATEVSAEAKSVAIRNASRILGSREAVRLELRDASPGEVLEPFVGLEGKADFLISNPPYLLRSRQEVDEEVDRCEPSVALYAPDGDPLYFYRKISEGAARYLVPRGWIFLEVPHERSREIADLFDPSEWTGEMVRDLSDRERVWIAQAVEPKG